MKNFKLMTLCLLGLSVYGLQAMREAKPVEVSRQVQDGKGQQEENEENIARKANIAERENVEVGKSGKPAEKVSLYESFKVWFTEKFPNSSWFRAKSVIKKDAQQVGTKANNLAKTTSNPVIAQKAEALADAATAVKTSVNASDDVQSQNAVSLLQAEANLVEAGKNASPADQDAIDQIGENLGSEHKQILDKMVESNPLAAPVVENQVAQLKSFSLGQPEAPVENQVQNLPVSSHQSLTLQPEETVVTNSPVSQGKSLLFSPKDLMAGGRTLRTANRTSPTIQKFSPTPTLIDAPVEIAEDPKNQEVTSSNIATTSGDLFEGIAKENVIKNQQVEQPIASEAIAQNQDVVVENHNAARIQELQAKGKNKTMVEAAELRRLTTQQTEVVTEISAIKQPGKIDTQAVDAQAMDAKTVENINKLIEQFNGNDIKLQVQSARDAYDQQYPNKTFGYKNTTAYKNGLKVVEAQAKDQVLSRVKNENAENIDNSPRSNREILNALNAKYRPQSPAKSVAAGTKSSGSNLTMQQEMRVKQIIRENPSINKDDAISQMQSEVAAQGATKESSSNSTGLANRQEVISSNEVIVSQADIDRQIYNDNKMSIDKQTAGLKGKDLASAKNQAVANIKETLSDNDLAAYKDKVIAKQQAEAKALADKEKERAAQIKAAKMKNEAPVSNLSDDDLRLVNNQIYENNKVSIDTQLQDAAVENPVLLRSSQMAKQFKLDAANKLRLAMPDDQQSTLLQQAKDAAVAKELAAAQAPVQELASVEPPKMSLADQLAANKAAKAAKAAAKAAQQAAQDAQQ